MFEQAATVSADPLGYPEPGREPDDAWTAPQLWVTDETAELDVSATLHRLLAAQPGPEVLTVAAALSELTLTDAQCVDLAVVFERCDGWLQAAKQPTFARLGRAAGNKDRTPGRYEDIALELALALRWSEWMCHDRMDSARLLQERLPDTWAALAAGNITYLQARLITAGAALLDHPDADDPIGAAAELERRVLPKAPTQTRAETEKAVTRAILGIDPQAAEDRRRRVHQDRRVIRTGRPRGLDGRLDGRAGLYVEGTPEDIATMWQALSLGADDLLAAGRVDTLSQGRHDTLLGWSITDLTRRQAEQTDRTPAPGARPTSITVIAHDTTIRGDDDPAELVGWGPITAETARDLAHGVPPRPGPFTDPTSPVDIETRLEFGHTQHDEIDDPDTITDADLTDHPDDDPPDDPDNGGSGGGGPPDEPRDHPPDAASSPTPPVTMRVLRIDPANGFAQPPPGLRLDYGTTRRTFPPPVVQHLRDKHRVCAFPGCTAPVHLLDGDHWQTVAQGGRTDATSNGGPCCAHHNRTTRNHPGWDIAPAGDAATLSTPHGRDYAVEPYDYRDL
jgi:hypothetical protein